MNVVNVGSDLALFAEGIQELLYRSELAIFLDQFIFPVD
jgi:hypothetical protein